MSHKSEFVSTKNGFKVQDGTLNATETPVINNDGEWVGTPIPSSALATANVGSVRTAVPTTTGATTGTLLAGSQFVTVTSAGANDIVILPEPVVGTTILLRNGATGYEIRSSAPATVAINGGVGAAAESAIGANVLVRLVCGTATTWVGTNFSTAGVVSATEVAA